MNEPVKNEPAFPCAFNFSGEANQTGMSLRDYFAAAAVQGCVQAAFSDDLLRRLGSQAAVCHAIANSAYDIADYMILERAKLK